MRASIIAVLLLAAFGAGSVYAADPAGGLDLMTSAGADAVAAAGDQDHVFRAGSRSRGRAHRCREHR